MNAISFCNGLTARPSQTLANHQKVMAAGIAAGFEGIRADCSFESIFGTTTLASADYTGIDRFITQARAYGYSHIHISLGPYVSVADASWEALLGTYGTAARLVKKRPPAGTANAGWLKIVDCINALLARMGALWVSLGGDITKFHLSIWQEPATGAADGPSTSDIVGGSTARADMIAAGHTGKWDDDALWDSMSGVNAGYANVRGFHDFCDFVFPLITWVAGMLWVLPALENSGNPETVGTGAYNEVATMFNPSYDWWVPVIAANGGVLDFDVHSYFGDIWSTRPRLPYVYAQGTNHFFQRTRARIVATWAAVIALATSIRWHCTEYGMKPESAFGTSTDGPTWTHQAYGDFLAETIATMVCQSGCHCVGFEEIMTDPTFGTETYGIINAAGNTSLAIGGVARANGAVIDITAGSPAWGGAWRTSGVEVPV